MNEAAEYLGITKGTLYVWVCQRKVPCVKVGRLTKFDINDIDAWINERKINEKY
jgi:excisionase family DNA binding protein